jgi:hypothetical protein
LKLIARIHFVDKDNMVAFFPFKLNAGMDKTDLLQTLLNDVNLKCLRDRSFAANPVDTERLYITILRDSCQSESK